MAHRPIELSKQTHQLLVVKGNLPNVHPRRVRSDHATSSRAHQGWSAKHRWVGQANATEIT